MEDLIPFLIFVVVVIINLVKFTAEKGGRKKKTPSSSGTTPSKRKPSALEAFFEDLAAKLEPQPAELAEWPEGRERPDYMQEMEDFESEQAGADEGDVTADTRPASPPEIEPVLPEISVAATDAPHPEQITALKSAMKSMPAMFSNTKSMRIVSTPMLRGSSAGRIDFPLREKAALRKAILANLIFSPPRAYEDSFDNTITK